MPSIVNGLFSGRSGIASHGLAIAAIGDNISNSSTVGFKSSRAEFADLVAGGQTAGKIIGSGSTNSAISTVFEQGTLEFTNRPLDLAIDGNGYFVLQKDSQKFYSRAGNFKVDDEGYIVTQDGLNVMGFPASGSGALENLSVNSISQSSVSTSEVTIAGNVDASSDTVNLTTFDAANPVSAAGAVTSTTTYTTLNDNAAFSTVVDVFDTLGTAHTVTVFFFHSGTGEFTMRGYANSEDVDPTGTATGIPRQLFSQVIDFEGDGTRTDPLDSGEVDLTVSNIPWNNGALTTQDIDFSFSPFTQYSSSSNIQAITQDGQGIGAVTSISVEADGSIFAVLDNGQTSTIGTVGLVNFSNPEGLTRIGSNLLQQSIASGEPIVGNPNSGTFGSIESGSIELSTVDIANEFVKLITVQRGFQANSRMITTIDQLLNEIIQLA